MSYYLENKHPRESTTHSLDTLLEGVMHNISVVSEGADPIKEHPGYARDVLRSGRSRLHIKADEGRSRSDLEEEVWAEVEAAFEKGSRLCESPIEREMLAALLTADWSFASIAYPPVHAGKDYDELFPASPVVIVPQMAVLRYRVDLGIVIRINGRAQLYGVECDGADYHNRDDDEVRDRYLGRCGVYVVRVIGQMIRRAPLASADEIVAGFAELSKK